MSTVWVAVLAVAALIGLAGILIGALLDDVDALAFAERAERDERSDADRRAA